MRRGPHESLPPRPQRRHQWNAREAPACVARMPAQVLVNDSSSIFETPDLYEHFRSDPIDEHRAHIAGDGLQDRERFFESALPCCVDADPEASHGVVRIDIDRSSHVLLSLVEQADVRIDHG